MATKRAEVTRAMIIAIGNIKGGVGKSTVSVNLAGRLAQQGKVAVMDTDKVQLSISSWQALRRFKKRPEPGFDVFESIKDPMGDLDRYVQRYDVVVIDIGANEPEALVAFGRRADLWIAPTGLSQPEMDSHINLLIATQGLKHRTGAALPLVTLFNRAPRGNKVQVTREVVAKEIPTATLLTSTLQRWAIYDQAWEMGQSIYERPANEDATAEFDAVIGEAIQHSLPIS